MAKKVARRTVTVTDGDILAQEGWYGRVLSCQAHSVFNKTCTIQTSTAKSNGRPQRVRCRPTSSKTQALQPERTLLYPNGIFVRVIAQNQSALCTGAADVNKVALPAHWRNRPHSSIRRQSEWICALPCARDQWLPFKMVRFTTGLPVAGYS